ncbi:zonular occludens toxin domain-containing protein [Pseudomonas tohonis]|uniref:zonular occludens toxin domain-containing protein n=1 Tax=Pseudomonas tohonis TaxID=2725477 RepID=UPI001F450586|nr:zonular occludens toxin domain-containing protein [Pseudomonas tohonis]GJN48258.1 hypothetical protein TUM20249_42440 [Pseudomonas tohonis]
MIFGLEGLPGSGKSLESMQHIHDALLAGRTVVTNIYGLNYELISESLAIPLETVQRLLIGLEVPDELDDEQAVAWVKQAFYERRINDCLWIWDEINQYWPPDRSALPAEWAKFVTEHRHLGMDILVMGQDLTELHSTWRKRLQRYTRLTKKDMMGKEHEYHWASLANSGRGRFKQTASGSKPYNKAFFGWYKSVRDETGNLSNYKDGRYSVFQGKHKFWMAVYGVFLLCGGIYMWQWFHPDPEMGHTTAETQNPAEIVAAAIPQPVDTEPIAVTELLPEATPPPTVEEEKERRAIDYLDNLAQTHRLRIGAYLERQEDTPGKRKWDFVLEALDGTYHVRERFGAAEVYALGWDIERTAYGFRITKEGVEHILRSWPIDIFGRVSNPAITQARSAGRPPAGLPAPAAPGSAANGGASTAPRVTVVGDSEYTSRPWR